MIRDTSVWFAVNQFWHVRTVAPRSERVVLAPRWGRIPASCAELDRVAGLSSFIQREQVPSFAFDQSLFVST